MWTRISQRQKWQSNKPQIFMFYFERRKNKEIKYCRKITAIAQRTSSTSSNLEVSGTARWACVLIRLFIMPRTYQSVRRPIIPQTLRLKEYNKNVNSHWHRAKVVVNAKKKNLWNLSFILWSSLHVFLKFFSLLLPL